MAEKTKKQAQAYESAMRVGTVAEWLIEGATSQQIINRVIEEKKWVTSSRQVERIIKKAKEKLVMDNDDIIRVKRAKEVQKLNNIEKKMLKKYQGHPSGITALVRISALRMKLEGTATPIKVEHSGDPAKPIQAEVRHEIDYAKLPNEVLKAIINARKATE